MARKEGSGFDNLWGFQDATKALREMLKFLDDLAHRAGKIYGFYKQGQRKKVATDLAYLHFYEGGSLTNVQRIASGTFDASDFEAIRRHMNATVTSVNDAIHRLGMYERLIREEVGIKSLVRFEELIEGQRGKLSIRDSLYKIANLGEGGRIEAQERAKRLVSMIKEFNAGIVELHDMILKERAAREAVAEKEAPPRARKKLVAKKRS